MDEYRLARTQRSTVTQSVYGCAVNSQQSGDHGKFLMVKHFVY